MATLSPPQSPHNDGRPRALTALSYQSHASRRSSHSANKLELTESAKDKRRLNAKSDPRQAMTEAQPVAVALAETTIEDLRGVQHHDIDGSVITDPDRSNPTRNRMERPLDTIRKWNAAAEGTSSRRSSYQNRPASAFGQDSYNNRRSSSYVNNNNNNNNSYGSPQGRPRPGAGGYYNNRNSSYGFRNDGYPEDGTPQPPYGRPQRQQNHPQHPMEDSPGSGHSYQQSYETMTSGSEEYGKSTGPSSQNSSFDRLHQMQMRKPDEYGNYHDTDMQHGYPGQPSGMRGAYPGSAESEHQSQQQRAGPPVGPNNPRQPIKLNTANSGPPPTQADFNKALPQKRQSWIKRKFSRKDSY